MRYVWQTGMEGRECEEMIVDIMKGNKKANSFQNSNFNLYQGKVVQLQGLQTYVITKFKDFQKAIEGIISDLKWYIISFTNSF